MIVIRLSNTSNIVGSCLAHCPQKYLHWSCHSSPRCVRPRWPASLSLRMSHMDYSNRFIRFTAGFVWLLALPGGCQFCSSWLCGRGVRRSHSHGRVIKAWKEWTTLPTCQLVMGMMGSVSISLLVPLNSETINRSYQTVSNSISCCYAMVRL